jgi:proteic killer suppression protein
VAIRSFAGRPAEQFFRTGEVGKRVGWAQVAHVVRRKLDMIDYASELLDLRSPPANRLEALKGSLKGFYSVRVNDQWRVIFRWTDGGPTDVDVVDYH